MTGDRPASEYEAIKADFLEDFPEEGRAAAGVAFDGTLIAASAKVRDAFRLLMWEMPLPLRKNFKNRR